MAIPESGTSPYDFVNCAELIEKRNIKTHSIFETVSTDSSLCFLPAKTLLAEEKKNEGRHFFIDDYQFERIWSAPDKYTCVLKGFKCVLTPDFLLYLDMPPPMQVREKRAQLV